MPKNDEPYVNTALKEAFEASKQKPRGLSRSLKAPSSSFAKHKGSSTSPIALQPKKKFIRTDSFRVLIVAGLVILIGLIFSPLPQIISEKVEESHASPAVNDIAKHTGFSLKGMLLFYRAHPEVVNPDTLDSKCPNATSAGVEFGCYSPGDNKMYILGVSDPAYKEIEYTTAVHETLHAAWNQLGSSARNQVTSDIKQFYNDKTNAAASALTVELQPYGTDDTTVVNELHSFIGSEYAVSNTSESLNSYYKQYFTDQSLTVAANEDFNNTINAKASSLDAQYQQLQSLSDSIDTYKVQHLDNIQAEMNRDDYLGDYYTYNLNVDAYNKNLVYYNGQVDTFNTEKATYNNNVETFNTVLRSFYPTRAQAQLFAQ